jgi:hypothetical protein
MATFNYTGSIQYFTVPAGGAGEYQIDAFGAQGGHEFAVSKRSTPDVWPRA